MSRKTEKAALKIMLEKREIDVQSGYFINNIVFKEVFNNLQSEKKITVVKKIFKKINKF